ncbi:Hypothetical protein LBF_2194 [Leptospira biflexa serovar Patoc strain 'Patoc 1 (Ames)']|uniref:Uncharacterized protein n=2 Tax=Leptospira biflexa TaxID=172 RepID=B0STB4_LEPBP|nr:Hypothetical protein LBF_2194 [Leptospira biflexa serovar Patoc strain 'Patoc 1 (Ames)']ABZ98354.1 Hypothetical protein LEPBI_I2258 [Leptospira biflexa serovar Patoc strain 'Patoc 1 (Paris)']
MVFSYPMDWEEYHSLEGGFTPLYFVRFHRLNLNNKKDNKPLLVINITKVNIETSLPKQIDIFYENNNKKSKINFDFSEKEIKIQINNKKYYNEHLSKKLNCLIEFNYFETSTSDEEVSKKRNLVYFNFESQINFWKNDKITIEVCNQPLKIDFKLNSIN